jgi:hypothetical protein
MTLKQLEHWLNNIKHLIADISICLRNGQRLAINKYDDEKDLKKFSFFSYYQFQLSFIAGIQLSKLLSESDNQKLNFFKLLKILESEPYDNPLKQKIKLKEVDDKKSRMEFVKALDGYRKLLESKNELIKSVTTVRDKAFAHHDEDRKPFGPSFEEYDELMKICLLIWNGLNRKISGASTILDVSNFDIDPIIIHAAKSYGQMINKRKKS